MSPRPVLPRGAESIVIAEDEEQLCSFIVRVLTSLGYTVHAATDGQAALDLLLALAQPEAEVPPCDLLLTDIVMPGGMTGLDLMLKLHELTPSLPAIYTSGYSPEILKQDSLLTQGINFLPKPYDLPALLKAVRLCLDGGKLPQYEVRNGKTQTITTIS